MHARSPGFSVVEIMVVVFILAIAAAVAIPMMNQDSVRVPATARMMAADLTYAQNVATTRQQQVYVLFQSSGGTVTGYSVATKETPASNADYVCKPGDSVPLSRSVGLSSGTTSGSPMAYCQITSAKTGTTDISKFAFDPQGQPLYNNGTNYVPFTSAGLIRIANLRNTFTADITIQPVTGLVSGPP